MEAATRVAREKGNAVLGEVLYDLAIIRGHAGKRDEALTALAEAIITNPNLKASASQDPDLVPLREMPEYAVMVEKSSLQAKPGEEEP